jgi:hypothetical protein
MVKKETDRKKAAAAVDDDDDDETRTRKQIITIKEINRKYSCFHLLANLAHVHVSVYINQ